MTPLRDSSAGHGVAEAMRPSPAAPAYAAHLVWPLCVRLLGVGVTKAEFLDVDGQCRWQPREDGETVTVVPVWGEDAEPLDEVAIGAAPGRFASRDGLVAQLGIWPGGNAVTLHAVPRDWLHDVEAALAARLQALKAAHPLAPTVVELAMIEAGLPDVGVCVLDPLGANWLDLVNHYRRIRCARAHYLAFVKRRLKAERRAWLGRMPKFEGAA